MEKYKKLVHDINSNQQIVINFLRLLEQRYPDGEANGFIDIVVKANKKAQGLIVELVAEIEADMNSNNSPVV